MTIQPVLWPVGTTPTPTDAEDETADSAGDEEESEG